MQTPLYYKVPDCRVRQFVGREDILQKIDDALSPGSGPSIAVLQGTRGQGKSQIALEYCHRKKSALYRAIFWVDATTEHNTKGSFSVISEELKKPAVILPDIKARVDFVLQMISSWSIRWLLVFDNYDNPNAFPNIADFIPQNDLGAVLVTSSHADSDALVADRDCQVIKLQGMDHDNAIRLLTQWVEKREFESRDANEIVERLAYHPLAIMQAGAYIEKAGLQLSDFKKSYEKKREEILKNMPPLSKYRKKQDDSEQETSLNLFTIWELFFQQLESQASENDSEVKLLTLFAFFNDKNISEELFAEFKANEETHPKSAGLLIWLNAFANGATGEWDSDAFAEKLVTLRDLSLLRVFSQGANGFYNLSLHPLLKDWIRLRTSKLVGQENTYMAATLVGGMILSSCRNDHFQLAELSKKNILPHVVELEEAFQEFFGPQGEMPASQEDIFGEYLDWQFWFSKFLNESGSYQLATIILKRLVAHEKEYLGLEHPKTLRSMSSLASAYRNQGRLKEVEELEVEITKMRERVLGLEHLDTLTSTANLASTYLHQGRWKEAEKLEMQVMQTRKRLLGLEHPETLTSMGNLASTYAHLGRWKEADELEGQVLQTRKRVLGLEHPETLTSVGNLASIYNHQGRLKEAEELGVQAMVMKKKVLGLEHVDTLTSMANLASIYSNQGRLREAEELEVQVVQTSKTVLGHDHVGTLTSAANLASTYIHQGRWKEAEELGIQVVQLRKRVLGIEHPNTLISMGNLASTYHHQGRLKEAEELELQVLQNKKRLLGLEHPNTLTSAANLASTYRDQGRWKEAEELEVVVLQTRKKVLGLDHPDTLTSTANLALTYSDQGR